MLEQQQTSADTSTQCTDAAFIRAFGGSSERQLRGRADSNKILQAIFHCKLLKFQKENLTNSDSGFACRRTAAHRADTRDDDSGDRGDRAAVFVVMAAS
jgi:hypothetical protein